jgi:general stress protein YciG
MAEKSLRGFAVMDREKQRAIASKGGRAAHAKGTAHEFTPEEAREAGRKGGQTSHGGPQSELHSSQPSMNGGQLQPAANSEVYMGHGSSEIVHKPI